MATDAFNDPPIGLGATVEQGGAHRPADDEDCSAQAAGDPHVGGGDDQPGYDAVEAFEPQAYVGGVVAFPARGEGAARRRPNFSR